MHSCWIDDGEIRTEKMYALIDNPFLPWLDTDNICTKCVDDVHWTIPHRFTKFKFQLSSIRY